MSDLDAVVVTHNSERDLAQMLRCEPLVRAFRRIVVVDNASTDGTRDLALRSGAVVVARDQNDGFGAAANEGVRRCTGPAFALLNPDIRFEGDDVVPLLMAELTTSSVGIVGPRLILPDGTTQDSAREVPSVWNLLQRRYTGKPHGAILTDRSCDVPWVVGACLFARRDAFDEIGGFDKRYFLYFEDVDLCVRMRHAGWRIRHVPEVVVQHDHGAASRAGMGSWATRQHIRSAARFLRAHPRFLL